MGMFRFAPNKRAMEATLDEQMHKIEEELGEAMKAYMDSAGLGDEHLAGELWDVVYAAEGALRKLPKETVEAEFTRCREKAKSRGDI